MPKVENYEDYFKELAKKAGLSDEQAAPVLEALKNDKIREGFVPRPNYSADLDSVKAKAAEESRAAAIAESKAFYDNWYKTEAKPAYDKALAIQDQLSKYQTTYGALDDGLNYSGSNGGSKQIKMEDVEKLVRDATAAQAAAFIDMNKKSMKFATKHLQEFNEVLDPDDLEKFAQTNGYSDIGQAYSAYISPRIQAKQTEEWEAKLKAAKEEGITEGRSRATASSVGAREYVNPFMKPSETTVDPNAGKNAFYAAWDEHANK